MVIVSSPWVPTNTASSPTSMGFTLLPVARASSGSTSTMHWSMQTLPTWRHRLPAYSTSMLLESRLARPSA